MRLERAGNRQIRTAAHQELPNSCPVLPWQTDEYQPPCLKAPADPVTTQYRVMMRNYSLATHDLTVSGNEITLGTIERLMNSFAVPLTVHLIFDKPFDNSPELYKFLKKMVESEKLGL